MEYEKGFWATVTLIGTVCLLHYFGGKQVFPWIAAHKLHTFYYVLAYFGLGTFWGINKWWFFVRRQRELYDEAHRLFLADRKKADEMKKYGVEQLPHRLIEALDSDWHDHVGFGHYNAIHFIYKPSYRRHKGKIMMWMTYWPWSFTWTMINDPIKKLFNAIIDSLRGLFTRISDRAFQGTDEHMGGVKVASAEEED
jgi:hypothetical protein